MGDARVIPAVVAAIVAADCALPRPAPVPAPPPVIVAEMPALPVQAVVSDSSSSAASQIRGGRVTLSAANADLRDVLTLLANAADVNLVVGPDVRGRISVRFQNVPAIDALYAVIEQAGLSIGGAAPEAPWMKPVFYDLPVNVNFASAAAIRQRFEVTQPLAIWIVKARTF